MQTQTAADRTLDETTEAEIDLRQLWEPVRQYWGQLSVAVILAAGLALAGTYLMTPMYKATIVVQLKSAGKKMGGLAVSPLADLAASAGVAIPGDDDANATLAKLKSEEFARQFIRHESLIDYLNGPTKDETLPWWRTVFGVAPEGEPKSGLTREYRKQELARQKFQKRLEISEDKKAGIVTLKLKWESPLQAAELTNKYVRTVDQMLREQSVGFAEKSLNYLNEELAKSSLVSVQQTIFRVMDDQVKAKMMAHVAEEFALRIIDPATPPLVKDSPNRLLIAVMVGFAALLVGYGYALFVVRRRCST